MITENEKLPIIQWIIETEDEAVISKVNAIRKEHILLGQQQKEVLNHRLKRYVGGTMEFRSWEDVKAKSGPSV